MGNGCLLTNLSRVIILCGEQMCSIECAVLDNFFKMIKVYTLTGRFLSNLLNCLVEIVP